MNGYPCVHIPDINGNHELWAFFGNGFIPREEYNCIIHIGVWDNTKNAMVFTHVKAFTTFTRLRKDIFSVEKTLIADRLKRTLSLLLDTKSLFVYHIEERKTLTLNKTKLK